MNFKTIITLISTLTLYPALNAQTETPPPSTKSNSIRVVIEKDKQAKFAVNTPIRREIELLDSLILQSAIDEEDLLFPADDLYSSWSTDFVHHYKDVVVPDSFQVDCSSYVAPFEGRVTSRFGPRRYRMHKGIDIKVEVGDTIVAAFDGKVRIRSFERKGYGYYLVIRHNNGLETVYGHLSKFIVAENDIVKAGQPIGLGGNTGRSTGSHLHFETRFLGIAINPEEIIDFANYVPHRDVYTFQKKKTTSPSYGNTDANGIVYHRVKSGETLSVIARKHGTSVSMLCKLNKLTTKSILRVGQRIRCN